MADQDKADALVVFTPSGKRGRFPLGTPVLTAARNLGVDIDSVCGGRAICGRCQITVAEGVCRWLVATTCQDRSFGARPLRRAIQRHIEDALSESLIMGRFPESGTVEIYVDGETLAFREVAAAQPTAESVPTDS